MVRGRTESRLRDVNISPFLENEQFGMLCSIDGQARQLTFRVADNNSNMSITRSHLTDSMTSLTSLSTISSVNQTNKTEVLQHLAKAIAEERCLLDKVTSEQRDTHTSPLLPRAFRHP